MAMTKFAEEYRKKMFPDKRPGLAETDPEFSELFNNL